jgi:hypothetical protein
MEILIILAVLVIGCWFLFFRESSSISVAAPYKVETPPTPEPAPVVAETAPVAVVESVVELAPVVAPTPVAEVAPAKKPRKPRAPKVVAPVEKPAVKKAAPVKKAAAIKAAPKKPATPRSKKA